MWNGYPGGTTKRCLLTYVFGNGRPTLEVYIDADMVGNVEEENPHLDI